ncbi:hypothetical protein [Thioalkalivibrio sp. HL-Eb18]|uniref:hypothetical protein n=1 Tax=Thioalkalivibrio sp. HL-Eb18 TaxID=1266913 RepID=UPI000363A4B7|nr:hypothetical protein [Thioalkalivibrio sp. HL-Eb18]
MNIIEFMQAPDLMGDTFTGDSWEPWRAVLSGAFGVPMDGDRLEHFNKLAGGREPPANRVRELYVIAGRRSAKTHNAAAAAVYLGTVGAELTGLLERLSPGERGVIALLAVDRQQAKVAMGYIQAMLEGSPVLSQLVERSGAESIDLTNKVSIEVHTNSFRAIRGRALLCVLMDELAFYRADNSASPDVEVYRAAVPGLATTGGMVIGFSSPYARRGLLYDKWRKHYGKPGDVLVVQGGTLDFNPTLDRRVIDDALEDDPEAAKAEWLGRFREDVEAFVSRAVVDAATRPGPLEVPYDRARQYQAFVDPAGGGRDEFTASIGHREGERMVIDVLRARTGTPATIVAEYADLLKSYGIRQATSDRYAGSWPADEFAKHGIKIEQSAKPKSDLYRDALAAFNSERVEIPPDDRLVTQLISLERRTSRSGKDSIDHPPGGHDDRANAVAGLVAANTREPGAGIRALCTW